jgi:hypothetical protein
VITLSTTTTVETTTRQIMEFPAAEIAKILRQHCNVPANATVDFIVLRDDLESAQVIVETFNRETK